MRYTSLIALLSIPALLLLAGCPPEESAEYPEQQYQYPQQGYPQQTYPQQGYPQQGYPQQQPAQPGYTPAPTAPAPTQPAPSATGSGQPSMIPGLIKMPDGTCQFTPPALSPDQPSQPMTVPCPPGI